MTSSDLMHRRMRRGEGGSFFNCSQERLHYLFGGLGCFFVLKGLGIKLAIH